MVKEKEMARFPALPVSVQVLLVGFVSLLVNLPELATCLASVPYPMGDSAEFFRLGQTIAYKGEYTSWVGDATAFFPPVYPAFIAAIAIVTGNVQEPVTLSAAGSPSAASFQPLAQYVLVLQYLLLAPMAGFAYLAARRCLAPALAITAALVAAIVMFPVGALMPEMLLACLAAIAAWILVREGGLTWKWAVTLGLVVSLGVLIKPSMIAFPAAYLLWRFWKDWRSPQVWKYGMAAILIPVLVIGAWVSRNYVQTGSPVIATEGGFVMWTGWTGVAKTTVLKYEPDDIVAKARAHGFVVALAETPYEYEGWLRLDTASEMKQDHEAVMDALRFGASNPLTTIKSMANSFAVLFPRGGHDSFYFERPASEIRRKVHHILAALTYIPIGIAAYLMVVFGISRRLPMIGRWLPTIPKQGLLELIVLLHALLFIGLHGEPRYMMPLYPIIAILGVHHLFSFKVFLRKEIA